MKYKIFSIFFTGAIIMCLFVGCENKIDKEDNTNSKPEVEDNQEEQKPENKPSYGVDEEAEPAEITVSFCSFGMIPTEEAIGVVETEINKITVPKINVTIKLNIMDVGSYVVGNAMSSGVENNENFDLILTAPGQNGHFLKMYQSDLLLPITNLLKEYATEMIDLLPENYLDATTIDGEVYAVSSYNNKINNYYWLCRTEVLEAIDLDISNVNTLSDVEEALQQIKDKTEYAPLLLSDKDGRADFMCSGFTGGHESENYVTLGKNSSDSVVVFLDDDTYTAVNYYETDYYKWAEKLLKEWYDKGLVEADIAGIENTFPLDVPSAASCFYVGKSDTVANNAKLYDFEYILIEPGVVTAENMLQYTWAIPTSCDEPEATVKFLNLLYTNADIINLIDYGVENVHYVKKTDGIIEFPEGVTQENAKYYLATTNQVIGNSFIAYQWDDISAESDKLNKAEMDEAKYSPLLGFVFDDTSVASIYDQLHSIEFAYDLMVKNGSFEERDYEEFIDELYRVGLQDYLNEANRQIQEWIEK